LITVVTRNVCGVPYLGSTLIRLRNIGEEICDLQPDVVALQEVHTWSGLKTIQSTLPDLPHAVFCQGRHGPAGGLVVLSRTAPRASWHTPFVSKSGRAHRKGLIVAKFKDFTAAAFHVSPNPLQEEFRRAWLNQLRQVAQLRQMLFGAAMDANERLIALGDANVQYGTELYWTMSSGFDNPFDSTPTLVDPRGSKYCVDYILIRGWKQAEATASRFGDANTGTLPSARRGRWSDHVGLKIELPV
jgi:endonuclease/exonuclease/phosphatase family metal-dependent hydrolase